MKELILFIIGFCFAFYIFRNRYSAINDISEFLLCLGRIDFNKLFNYDLKIEMRKSLEWLDIRAPNFDVDLTSTIFEDHPFKDHPQVVGRDLGLNLQKILKFLDGGYSLHNDYFRINTGLISEFLSKHDKLEGKLDFIKEYIICNSMLSQMAESIRSGGSWALDQNQEYQLRRRFEPLFYNWTGPYSIGLDEMEENQLNQVVFSCLSEGKKGLISLIESIKQKYIKNRSKHAIKRVSIVFIILASLQALFFFVWHIDLLDRTAELLGALLANLAR